MDASSPAEWSAFFAAETGAAAALAGLVIVAISINVARILADPLLPGRAAETLVQPTGALIASTFALVPNSPSWLLGAELIFVGAAMSLVPAAIQFGSLRLIRAHPVMRLVARIFVAQISGLPILAAGIMMAAGIDGALYWTVPGIVAALIGTVLNSWVLLVEILR